MSESGSPPFNACGVHGLHEAHLVHGLEEVQERTRAPRLRLARVVAIASVLIRQLGKTRPGIVQNVTTRRQQKSMEIVKSLRGILSHGLIY